MLKIGMTRLTKKFLKTIMIVKEVVATL